MGGEVLVFQLPGCVACHSALPALRNMRAILEQNGWRLRTIDASKERTTAEEYKVTHVPTVILVKEDGVSTRLADATVDSLRAAILKPSRYLKRERVDRVLRAVREEGAKVVYLCADKGSRELVEWQQHCNVSSRDYVRLHSHKSVFGDASSPHVVIVTPASGIQLALESADFARADIYTKLDALIERVP